VEFNHRIADALSVVSFAQKAEIRSVGSGELGLMADPARARTRLISQPLRSTNRFSVLGEMMFGPYPRSKALCSCGEIAEMDSSVVRLKRRLGKDIECRTCRNERIAKELEALGLHFSGQEEEYS
jgi:hypothetical protein